MHRRLLLGGVLALCEFGSASPCTGQGMRTLSVSRPTGSERFLHVTLDFSGGSLILLPAATGKLYGMRVRYDPARYSPIQQYDPRTGILHLGVEAVGSTGVRLMSGSQLEQVAQLEFAADVPLTLSATLGASDATLDLGGTTLAALEIHGSATRASVDFSRPTRGSCKSARFTVGASELEVQHLAQAGCTALLVDGGAGHTTLGFQGEWRADPTLVVDLALGGLDLQIPRGTGVRVTGERFLAPWDREGMVKSGDAWITPGFDQAPHKLRIELKASMLRINIEWLNK